MKSYTRHLAITAFLAVAFAQLGFCRGGDSVARLAGQARAYIPRPQTVKGPPGIGAGDDLAGAGGYSGQRGPGQQGPGQGAAPLGVGGQKGGGGRKPEPDVPDLDIPDDNPALTSETATQSPEETMACCAIFCPACLDRNRTSPSPSAPYSSSRPVAAGRDRLQPAAVGVFGGLGILVVGFLV